MSKENRSTIPYCILKLFGLVPFWTIKYHLSAWWSWPWQHIYFNTCELLKFIGVMYGECMLVGCRLRKERTEFKANLYDIETQCPLERNTLPLAAVMVIVRALYSPVRSERQRVLQCTPLPSQSGWRITLALFSFFLYVWFSDISDRIQKKTSKLELTKGKKMISLK